MSEGHAGLFAAEIKVVAPPADEFKVVLVPLIGVAAFGHSNLFEPANQLSHLLFTSVRFTVGGRLAFPGGFAAVNEFDEGGCEFVAAVALPLEEAAEVDGGGFAFECEIPLIVVDDSGGGFISAFAVDEFAPVAAGPFPI